MKITLFNYGHNNCLLGGEIYNSDFCTDNPPRTLPNQGSRMASRIIADGSFDQMCLKNMITRKKNEEFQTMKAQECATV